MVVGVGWVVGVGAREGRVVVGLLPDLMARFAVASEMDMTVPSARLDSFVLLIGAAQAPSVDFNLFCGATMAPRGDYS